MFHPIAQSTTKETPLVPLDTSPLKRRVSRGEAAETDEESRLDRKVPKCALVFSRSKRGREKLERARKKLKYLFEHKVAAVLHHHEYGGRAVKGAPNPKTYDTF